MAGMLIDLTGDVFGRLTVIAKAESAQGHAQWLCRCSCGGESTVLGRKLRQGVTRSCGCLKGARAVLDHEMDVLVENVEWMLQCSEHPERIAKRVGKRPRSLADLLRNHGRPDLAVPFEPAAYRDAS